MVPPARPAHLGSLLLVVASLGGGCGDPVREAQIRALGPERPGVRPGPNHRPGQPCLLCHGAGGVEDEMSVAGTVYRRASRAEPLGGAEVLIVDARRVTYTARTNAAGNFYVSRRRYDLKPPAWVAVRSGGGAALTMESPLNRDGDCNGCHLDPKGPAAAGHVFAELDP